MKKNEKHQLLDQSISLMMDFLAIPAYSGHEADRCGFLLGYLQGHGLDVKRLGNNLWTTSSGFDANLPTVLLNTHIDTVRPNTAFTRSPHVPELKNEALFALGSTDAGGAVAAMIAAFRTYEKRLIKPFNLVLLLSAEEENSGHGGIPLVWPALPVIDMAIVGEPTEMQAAVAERGLLVIDAHCTGKGGHAARNEGENAIYKALEDIQWLRNHRWERSSPYLGEVQQQVTLINAGTQHNVVPDLCSYTIDVRLNEHYTHEEVLQVLGGSLKANLTPRSMNLRSTGIAENHPLKRCAENLGLRCYGSPTLSDMARIPVPAIKMGPGWSGRSHTADEFLLIDELHAGLWAYDEFLTALEKEL